ncbi:MAG: glycosyltransferase [bacterium]|nr:glycosyltransferase [bacterium]MDD5756556.1 glycosyltransferase [bacterium]
MNYPSVSILIPVFNRSQQLSACLQAIALLDWPKEKLEIIVIDDGSTEDLSLVTSGNPVRLIRQEHQGDTAARNLGAELAVNEFLFFVDSDVQLQPSTLKILYQALAGKKAAAARGAYKNESKSLISRFIQVDFEYRQRLLSRNEQIDLLDTACALINRQVFINVGGFDRSISVCGDVEISYKLNSRGYKLIFVPGAVYYHRHCEKVFAYLANKYRKGFWRTKVFILFPKKFVKDSYTPQSLKLQAGLLLASIIIILYGLFYKDMVLRFWWQLTVIIALLFLASLASFIVYSFRRDKLIALVSPWLVGLRTLGLSVGALHAICSYYAHKFNLARKV